MVKAIEGTYENGQLTLNETFPTSKKTKVVVLILEDENPATTQRKPGGLSHLGGSIPVDFNAPLDDLNDYM
ncbi:hypothetical protein [Spirosoma rhododendri]|uniref:DUF2281 domain-containing protein n=1 Tax=Spirosoma rhododendri TaxID=2728024 RepID=A0A7L5DML7_9BACT|nr:hypothetical protein [Spirosoma rhododendri]QJD79646.1 hypothetical protein HH216_15380 [Spirosoma rhododendri]